MLCDWEAHRGRRGLHASNARDGEARLQCKRELHASNARNGEAQLQWRACSECLDRALVRVKLEQMGPGWRWRWHCWMDLCKRDMRPTPTNGDERDGEAEAQVRPDALHALMLLVLEVRVDEQPCGDGKREQHLGEV